VIKRTGTWGQGNACTNVNEVCYNSMKNKPEIDMKSLSQSIDITKQELISALTAITDENTLESVRVAFLGRKGKIADFMEQLKTLSIEEKKIVGPLLNQL